MIPRDDRRIVHASDSYMDSYYRIDPQPKKVSSGRRYSFHRILSPIYRHKRDTLLHVHRHPWSPASLLLARLAAYHSGSTVVGRSRIPFWSIGEKKKQTQVESVFEIFFYSLYLIHEKKSQEKAPRRSRQVRQETCREKITRESEKMTVAGIGDKQHCRICGGTCGELSGCRIAYRRHEHLSIVRPVSKSFCAGRTYLLHMGTYLSSGPRIRNMADGRPLQKKEYGNHQESGYLFSDFLCS